MIVNKFNSKEGAIEGIRWNYLSANVKNDLRDFFEHIK
jgi:hypothetical protein